MTSIVDRKSYYILNLIKSITQDQEKVKYLFSVREHPNFYYVLAVLSNKTNSYIKYPDIRESISVERTFPSDLTLKSEALAIKFGVDRFQDDLFLEENFVRMFNAACKSMNIKLDYSFNHGYKWINTERDYYLVDV